MKYRLVLVLILISQSLFSQEEKKGLRDFFSPPKDTSSQVVELDTSMTFIEDTLHINCLHPDGFKESFDSVTNENDFVPTSSYVPEFVSLDTIVPVIEDTLPHYDTTYWCTIDTCYKKLDQFNVNPYHIDGLTLKDTFPLQLCDTVRKWCMPLDSGCHLTSKFGPRGYRYHYGDDLRLKTGDSVRSVFDGVVRISKYNRGGYGNYVLIRHHNGTETLYGHLSEKLVKVGQIVKAGECIGLGGNTGRSSGPHLHFEVRYKGNAIDPEAVFSFKENKLISEVLVMQPSLFHYIAIQRQKVYHVIRSGDTLYAIARRYHVRASQICRLNGISTRTTLRIGRKLRIK